MATPTVQVSSDGLFELLLAILVGAAILFPLGLIRLVRNDRGRPSQSRILLIVALAVGFAVAVGLLGYGAFQVYVSENTWTFTYSVSILANGTSPESVVVPVSQDAGLLTGLHLSNGTANWSLVDTPNGRGLFIRFMGSTNLRVDVAIYPPPAPVPNVGPTMELPYNASEDGYRWWIFYSGNAGGVLELTLGCYDLHTYLVSGWTAAEAWCLNPPLPPLA